MNGLAVQIHDFCIGVTREMRRGVCVLCRRFKKFHIDLHIVIATHLARHANTKVLNLSRRSIHKIPTKIASFPLYMAAQNKGLSSRCDAPDLSQWKCANRYEIF